MEIEIIDKGTKGIFALEKIVITWNEKSTLKLFRSCSATKPANIRWLVVLLKEFRVNAVMHVAEKVTILAETKSSLLQSTTTMKLMT